jgi:hypothetical protein
VKELEQIKKQALLVKEFSSNTKSQVIASDVQAVVQADRILTHPADSILTQDG